MKIAINPLVYGKPYKIPNPITKQDDLFIDGKQVNLGYNWQTIDESFADIYEIITVDGFASSAALTNQHKCEKNFQSRELVMIDIDENMTLIDLHDNEFYMTYGAGFYTTPSHTEEHHKFRILFKLQTPITDYEKMKRLHTALMLIYPQSDESCKDATRIFFGTVKCALRDKRNNILDDAMVEQLFTLLASLPQVIPKTNSTSSTSSNILTNIDNKTYNEVCTYLDELRKHYSILRYADRRNVTWAVANYLNTNETINAMRTRWDDGDCNQKYEKILKPFKAGKLTMGSVMHMIRLKDPTYMRSNKTKHTSISHNEIQADSSYDDAINKKGNKL